jgi:hypothetical protein
MATKEKAPKAEKAPKEIILDSAIIKDYRQMVKNSLESHWQFISTTNGKMVDGSASVRIVKASITEASKDGQDSIIKASQVEGFGIALKVKGLIGAEKQTISNILKVSMRAKRIDGVDGVDSLLDGIKSWVGFIDRLENAEAEKAEAKEAEAEATEEAKPKELDLAGITWEALAEIVIKKAKMEKNMVDATCEIKLAGQATAIFNTLVKNTQAKAKVNA